MSRITQEVVEAVRSAADIVDLAGDATTLKRQGRKYVGLCPFHKEKSPSFQVDPDLGLYHCFGCGAGGDAIRMHMELTGDDFVTAMESLARRYSIPIVDVDRRDGAAPRVDLTSVLEEAQAFFRRQLERHQMPQEYLRKRQIPVALQERYGIGFAPDAWEGLLKHLRRVDNEKLQTAGLVARSDRSGDLYDRFRNRLMFPIHNASGRLVGFGGRTLGEDRAKYINTAETPAFRKGELLYGLNTAKRDIRDSKRVVLVEGYLDVIALAACDVPNAVAAMGTALTPEQAKLIARFAEVVVMAYDGDEAGGKASRRALPVLLGAGLGAQRAMMPAGHDPDSLRVEAGPDAVSQMIATAEDAVRLEIDHQTSDRTLDPTARAKIADEIRQMLVAIRHPVTRSAYARMAAQRLGVDEELLLKARAGELFTRGLESGSESSSSDKWSGERRALQLLLSPDVVLPSPEDLLPPAAFLEPTHRRLYQVFMNFYAEHDRAPSAKDMLSTLADEVELTQRVADLVMTESESTESLGKAFASLEQRYVQQRIRQLQPEIRAASERGDDDAIDLLLEEKAWLNRRRHPGMTGRFW